MARVIAVLSGKGGVGKTTVVSNVGAALVNKGKNVTIIDGNVTTPNLSLHLGIPFYPVTLQDVLKKDFPIESAIYNHSSGLKIIPSSLAADDVKETNIDKLEGVLLNLLGKTDIILVDGAACLGKEALATMNMADEIIVVTNPELPAVTDALRTITLAKENGIKILGVVVNRVRSLRYELSLSEIKSMLDVPLIASIPEDIAVQKSIAKRMPVVNYKPKSSASIRLNRLASRIIGEPLDMRERKGWFERLFFWLY